MKSHDVPASAANLSPEKLALLVKMQQRKKKEAEAAEATATGRIPRRPGKEPALASFTQQRLWLLDRLDPDTTAYSMPALLRLTGALDTAALVRALTEIVRRHEALRTTFSTVDGLPVQVVAPPGPAAFALADLSGLPEPARLQEQEIQVTAASKRPFDLERGPLFRVTLLRLSASEHLMFLDVHHIVSDGWSLGVLLNELSRLYGAFRAGQPSPLPELPVQFADFAVWQRGWLEGEVLQQQLAYWREQLAGSPPVLDLPTDRLRPAIQSHRGGSAGHQLPRELTERLHELSRREGVSLFMTLLAGFSLLLSRLSGQEDVVVGSPSAGRGRTEVEGLIGLFLNTLVLRTDLSGNPSFRELLGRVREVALGADRHQELPFERLLEELQPERLLSRTPIFQVLFNFVSVPEMKLDIPGLETTLLPLPQPDSKFDFTLYVQANETIFLQMVYNADLFSQARMDELLRQLEHVLAQAAAAPQAPVGSLSLLTPAANAILPDPALRLAADWRGAAHQALSRQAARTPQKTAVSDAAGESWTYGELEARSNQLARFLRAGGVGTGDVVAVWAHRNASLVWAVLGTLKAGGAFLLLDPAYPASRLLAYLEIGRPVAWLHVEGAPPPPPEVEQAAAGLCRLRLELPSRSEAERQGFLADLSGVDPEIPVGPENAAYISFTSGSTGMPKGVVGRHGPLTHFYPWMAERFGLGEDDRFGMLAALSHDPLQRDIFTPLWLGASLHVPDPDGIGQPGYLADWVRRQGVTVLHLTPAMMELLISSVEDGTGLPSLRRTFVVGDLLKKGDVEALQGLAPAVTCVNLYGSTETQRSVSYFVVPRPGESDADSLVKEVLPLGRGMEGCQLLVLRDGQRTGVGELGEIHVRGHHLARGYLGDPELTAQRFLPNPFTGAEGDRLYRTGDLGRYLPDGGVEFAGRADFQIKLRGFRIELGEVEAALARHPAVQECVATVREDRPGDRRLVAYLVVASEPVPPPRELRAFLSTRLPDYMVPASFVALPALPLTRTGKVDRRALPPPAEENREDSVVERSPVEELIAGIWAGLLGVEKVGPGDNFFELGGQSLVATRMLSRVRQVLGIELPARVVFEEPTLGGFAALVERAQRQEAGLAQAPPLVPVPRDGGLPLSFSQLRLWFLDQLEPGSFAYNLAGAVRLSGPLDLQALARTLTEIVRRHESLRTTFAEAEDGAVQIVAPPAPLVPPLLDLSGLPPEARQEEMLRLATREMRRPFDLAAGPLLRVTLVHLEAGEHALMLAMHHIISDGWSLNIFVRELGALYSAFVAGELSPLPELAVQYADFAAWQRGWLSGEVLEAQLAYWRQQLAGAPAVLELPLDRPRPAVQSYRGARVAQSFGRELDERLAAMARRLAVTPFMVLLGGFAALLSRYGGQTDVVVGTPIANRSRAELEDLIGFFANTLALRTDLSGEPSFADLARQIRDAALGAYAHQDLPLERLVEELRPERDLSHSPVFQVMLILQNLPEEVLELPGLTLSPMEVDGGRSQFDLTLTVYPGMAPDGGPLSRLEHSTDLFDRATAERLLAHLRNFLEGIVENPQRPVFDLPLLTPEERLELLAVGNDTAVEAPDRLVHQLFEAMAAVQPGAIAVSQEPASLSYQNLNLQANRLAHHLRRLGIGPESLVGVCIERSPALLVALLGVLKAGGAYVPLDPSYPADRLAWVLEDSRAAVLLTERSLVSGLPPHSGRVLLLDEVDLAAESADDPIPLATPENLAYVIYTSGSTGRPKGVAVRQHGAANFLASMARRPGLDAEDVMVAVTTIAFDIAVLELFLPLAVGARIELVDRETAADGLRLAQRIDQAGATVMQATPATWRLLLEAGWEGRHGLKVLCGGEALPPELARELLARVGSLWNVYGPTETTVWSAVHAVAAEDAERQRPMPIGKAIDNTEIYLLGRFERGLDPVPPGSAGELYIGGEGLARGYLGRPDLTAERFVPDPFSNHPGDRLYRTGDLVRRRPLEGALEFLGRVDHQVKIRGFRIELGEIESVLGAQPAVRGCAVVVREDVPGSKRLAGYLALHEGFPEAEALAAVRSSLREKLPDYMVPHLLVVLPELPLTPNGKIDRRALLASPAPESGPTEEHVAPRNPVEQLLADVWAEVLGLERVGIRDNFFALGGDSILAIQAVTRSRKRGLRFTPRQLFQNQTIAQLAGVADTSGLQGPGAPQLVPATPVVQAGPRLESQQLAPNHFPEAGLSQDELDDLLAGLSE